MKRAAIATGVALAGLAATGCGPPDSRRVLMESCYDQGGAYFEYESTSAGAHVWCVGPDGEQIAVSVSEGDD